MELRRFEPHEICALDPRAFGMLVAAPKRPAPEIVQGVAVLRIQGPLTLHCDPYAISYEEILAWARGLAAEAPRAVVLRIDSPGGLASGCFEASRELRAIFDGIPIYAHVSGQACSAAYALACAADEISVASTGIVGSIGVIDALVDCTEADKKSGVTFHLIKSGARKADGNPHEKVDSAAIAARQKIVDEFADQFFDLVASRRGISSADVAGLDAGIFSGASAVQVGLADRVEDYSEFFSRISAGDQPAPAPAAAERGAVTMATEDRDDVFAILRKLAESDDEKEAARAKKALAALEDDEESAPEPEEKAKGKAKAKAKSKAKAEGDEEPEAKSEGDEEPEAKASAEATILSLSAKLARLERDLAEKAEAEERKALLASRPDLPSETVAWLETQPLEAVRGALEAIPKIPGKLESIAATAVVGGSRGDYASPDRIDPVLSAQMDRVMGLEATERVAERIGNRVVFGAVKRKEA